MFRFRLPTAVFTAILFILAACAPSPAAPAPTAPLSQGNAEAAAQAGQWLVATHQNDDGGYTAFSGGANLAPSSVPGTVDALFALVASDASAISEPAGYLQANSADVADFVSQGGGNAGKILMVLTAVGQSPRDFGGYNLVISTTQQISPTGQINATTSYNQALAILGLSAAGEEVPATAVAWLVAQQTAAGSWPDGFGTDDNTDATGLAVMALVAAGAEVGDTAVSFLRTAQNEDGGWGYASDSPSNPNSSALAIQALIALGEDVSSAESAWAKAGVAPLDALLSFQSDTGAFQADFGDGPFDDFYATVQALPAVAGQAFPLVRE